MASIWDLFKRGLHVDNASLHQNRVNKILGHNQPMYTLPHIQWQNHLSNMQNNASNNLINIGRYSKLRIKR